MFAPTAPSVDFVALEKEIFKYWQENKIEAKYLNRNKASKKRFSFLDGPITANNPMGVHHAWGRTYKDLWQRYFNMHGYKQRFQNGFDCQGLWVEVEVEKELGFKSKKDIEVFGVAEFVQKCRERVLKFSQIQTEQSKRLGYFMDWDNSYYTMSDENNYMIWHFLKVAHEKGWIYKGKDSVPWCPRCETAISQHEMLTEDYKELTHETVFLKLPIDSKGFDNTYLLVWTTTPWTIPANVAVGVNTKFTYTVWENKTTGEKIIILKNDDTGIIPKRNVKNKEIILEEFIFGNLLKDFEKTQTEYNGMELLGIKYKAPFDYLPIVVSANKENPRTFHSVVNASEVVTSTEGTGLLHLAPGAGQEDFKIGKKENLPVISPILDNADYAATMGEFSGKNAKKHPELILDELKKKENGRYLLRTLQFTHRYPACWRCKTELVWKVAFEWYIAMDTKENGKGMVLREQMKQTAAKIGWHPSFGLDRELDWLANMHDWLISKKNRYWGLALPIYECEKCGWFDVIGSKEELKQKAFKGWDEFEDHTPHKPYIDNVKIKCQKCGEIISRIDDVGNVWLDAGIVPFSTYIDPKTKQLSYTSDKKYWREWFPSEFITESFPGQFKNWFYSMIAMSTVLEKTNPFKTVLGFATLLGEDGRPMHKSWGNSIEFNEGADKIGSDVMRWMFAKADPEQNVLFGYKRADETRRKFHILLWNVYNFFVTYANIDKFDPKKNGNQNSLHILDKWLISRLNSTVKTVTESLNSFDAKSASLGLEEFVSDLSQWYIRRSRDRVGPTVTGDDKYSFYQTTYSVLLTLTGLLAPFTPFLAEKIYCDLTQNESVHLLSFPEAEITLIDSELESQMKIAREIVEKGHSLRKEKKIKVRVPLLKMEITSESEVSKFSDNVWQVVLEELNIKNIVINGKIKFPKKEVIVSAELLVKEGQAREIIRNIQILRKENKLAITDKIKLILPAWPEEFAGYIIKETLATDLEKGKSVSVIKV